MQNEEYVRRLRSQLGTWLDNSRKAFQAKLKPGQTTKFSGLTSLPSVFGFRNSAEKTDKENASSHALLSFIPHDSSATPSTIAALPGGKLGEIVRLMNCDSGTSLDEIMALTGWQRHTVRAALSRLRKRGFAILAQQHNGQTTYALQQDQ